MKKSLLISIQPQHALNILYKIKTLELRKRVPKKIIEQIKNEEIDGVWVYVYVTKRYPLLNYIDGKHKLMDRKNHTIFHNIGMYEFYNDDIHLNGKVVARFWFDEYEKYTCDDYYSWHDKRMSINYDKVFDKLQLDYFQVCDYGNGKDLYAWHIKNLEIFDKPMQLSEFYGKQKMTKSQLDFISRHGCRNDDYEYYRLTKAPQSYQFVWVKEAESA